MEAVKAMAQNGKKQVSEAVVAFIGSLRAERRLYPELYADRLAEFLEEVQDEGLAGPLKRLRKELPQ